MLQAGQFYFGRPQGPAGVSGQRLDRMACFVERAYIAEFGWGTVFELVDPAQRQALGAADIGAPVVDAASALGVEESASACRVGLAVCQQIGIMPLDRCRLGLEDGEVVDAAVGAAATALQTFGVQDVQGTCLSVDFGVEVFDCVFHGNTAFKVYMSGRSQLGMCHQFFSSFFI